MRSLMVAAVLSVAALAHGAPAIYGIGRAPSSDELRAADISIAPDGAGLPAGHGSTREGAALYQSLCAACHGANGEGRGDFPALVGGRGSLGTASPVLTVGSYWPYATTLWDYTRRAMPYLSPGVLSTDQVYALTAFVLQLNAVITADMILTETTLPRVQMPNRDGFIADPRPDVPAKSAPLR
jgi:mono/diheme cytochrome c family protein